MRIRKIPLVTFIEKIVDKPSSFCYQQRLIDHFFNLSFSSWTINLKIIICSSQTIILTSNAPLIKNRNWLAINYSIILSEVVFTRYASKKKKLYTPNRVRANLCKKHDIYFYKNLFDFSFVAARDFKI